MLYRIGADCYQANDNAQYMGCIIRHHRHIVAEKSAAAFDQARLTQSEHWYTLFQLSQHLRRREEELDRFTGKIHL